MADTKTRFAFYTMCYDAASMIVWGMLAIDALLSATYAFGTYTSLSVTLWGSSISMIIFGLVMVMAAILASSEKTGRNSMGGVIGIAISALGALVSIYFVHSVSGVNLYGTDLSYTYSVLGLPVVLFVGFPLGLMGSLWSLRSGRSEAAAEPAAEAPVPPTP